MAFEDKPERAAGNGQCLYGGVMINLRKSSGPPPAGRAKSFRQENEMNLSIRDTDPLHLASPVKRHIPTLFGARTFLGDEVYSRREDRLGKLKEFMLDLDSGRICYAVMSSGGFLGVGEKLFVIPWRALTLDAENACFVLDIAEERLTNLPGFDKRHWPDMRDAAWVKEIDTFYGIKPETRSGRDISL